MGRRSTHRMRSGEQEETLVFKAASAGPFEQGVHDRILAVLSGIEEVSRYTIDATLGEFKIISVPVDSVQRIKDLVLTNQKLTGKLLLELIT